MNFKWDPRKDRENRRRHGVSFQEATTIFGDTLAGTIPDPDHAMAEARYLTIGYSSNAGSLLYPTRNKTRISASSAPERRTPMSEKHTSRKPLKASEPDMRSQYDFSGAVRGRYYRRYIESSNVVVIAPDVHEEFKNSAAVNEALRKLIRVPGKKRGLTRRPTRTRARAARAGEPPVAADVRRASTRLVENTAGPIQGWRWRPVNDVLDALKEELERFGEANDAATSERPRRMLNITRETGEFLAVLVRATAARRVLEIGTSNGYSTLWLAEAARATGGKVTTVERAAYKAGLASANFARSGLAASIALVHEEAGRFLRRGGEGAYDFVFLDSERPEYPGWWPDLRRVLRSGGVLVADNAISHAAQLAPFVALVKADAGFATCLVPVGNGEFMAVKAAP